MFLYLDPIILQHLYTKHQVFPIHITSSSMLLSYDATASLPPSWLVCSSLNKHHHYWIPYHTHATFQLLHTCYYHECIQLANKRRDTCVSIMTQYKNQDHPAAGQVIHCAIVMIKEDMDEYKEASFSIQKLLLNNLVVASVTIIQVKGWSLQLHHSHQKHDVRNVSHF